MRTQKQVLRRIRILYYAFFAVLVGSVVTGVMSRDFRSGFKEGYDGGARSFHDPSGSDYQRRQYRFLELDAPLRQGYPIPISTNGDSSLSIRGRINMLDIEVLSKPSAGMLFGGRTIATGLLFVCALFMYGAVFVLLFIILNSLHRSSRSNNVFARANVTRTRWIGILLITASIFSETGTYIENYSAAQLLVGTAYTVLPGSPVAFGELILGIMMLFVAEIFNIGYDMSEEEQLTI